MSDETPTPEKRAAPWRGRPRVDNPRSSWVHVRVTADERKALEAASERVEMHLGPYLVSAALNAPQRRSTRKPAVERKQLAQLLGWMGKAGGNLNQLAKVANETGRAPEAEALEAVREEVREASRAISAALRGRRES